MSLFVLDSFQLTDLSNPLLRCFDSFWLSLVDKVTTGTYNFVSLIVKIMLLSSLLPLALSAPATDKTQCFVHLSSNSTLELINRISSDLQKLLKYFNSTAIITFFRISIAAFDVGWAAVFPNNLALYLKELNLLSLAISALKLVTSSLEQNNKIPVVSE